MDLEPDLKDAYRVELASKAFRQVVPRPRTGDYSLPLTRDRKLSIDAEFRVGDTLLHEFDLDEYVGASNAEPPSRPVPEVFRASDTDAVTQAVVPLLPELMEWLVPQIKAPWQSFNEVSRMGAPFYKPFDNKRYILKALLNAYLNSDFSILADPVVQIGVRIQQEVLSKKRRFTFVDDDGRVYKRELDRSKCKVPVWGHQRYPGRVRPVFNQPIFNLHNQFVDTALNDVYGGHPAFHHDMTSAGEQVRGPILAFDVSHMERLTARIVYERARVIGGPYFAFQHHMRGVPFLVPSDTGSRNFKLTCNYDGGWMVQFGSGNSAVAPSQKDIFMCLYRLAANQLLGVPREMGFDWVARGGDDRLRIFNFGDDNFIFSPKGDEGLLQAVFDFMSQYLTISVEDPPKFLGHEYDGHRFVLTTASYLLKTYQNERAPVPPFRRFPNLGWVEKRKHYGKFGVPDLPLKVFPREDALLKQNGTSFADVVHAAIKERSDLEQEAAVNRAYFLSAAYLMGKQDYLLDHEMKAKVGSLGGFVGFSPAETGPVVRQAIDPKWAAKLTYS